VSLVSAGCATERADEAVPGALPTPGFAEGWQVDETVRTFDQDTIFEHINGEAELYFPYGFEQAATVTYVSKPSGTESIQADLYQMGSLLDAFGIYSNYRYPDSEFVELGGEGFRNPYQLLFYQDRYFIRLSAFGDPAQTGDALQACAQAIAARLPGPGQQPTELSYLNVEGANPSAVQYIAESLLGYAFFPKGVITEVDTAGGKARVFAVLTDSEPEAAAALDAYLKHLAENDATHERDVARDRIITRDPLHKDLTIQQTGRFLVGACNLPDMEAGAALVDGLADNVKGR
jgi:hypothetical protein